MLRGRAASSSPGRHRGAGRRRDLAEGEPVFPGRFMIGYLLIVLFFGALLIGFAVAWSRHSDDSGDTATTWSFFKPTADSERVARGRSRASSATATRRMTDSSSPVCSAARRGPGRAGQQFLIRDAGKQESIGSRKAIMYILCGAGVDCALPLSLLDAAGGSSAARRSSWRSTMRYNDVDPIVVLLPDPQGNPGTRSCSGATTSRACSTSRCRNRCRPGRRRTRSAWTTSRPPRSTTSR